MWICYNTYPHTGGYHVVVSTWPANLMTNPSAVWLQMWKCVFQGKRYLKCNFSNQKLGKVTQLRILRIIPVFARPSWLHIHILAAKLWVVLESQVCVASHGKNLQFCQQGVIIGLNGWICWSLQTGYRVSWLPTMKPPIKMIILGYFGSSVLRHPKKVRKNRWQNTSLVVFSYCLIHTLAGEW